MNARKLELPARPAHQPESPRREALAELVRTVREDAHAAPEAYLRETRVPGGGE